MTRNVLDRRKERTVKRLIALAAMIVGTGAQAVTKPFSLRVA